jgi:hypothetical protein
MFILGNALPPSRREAPYSSQQSQRRRPNYLLKYKTQNPQQNCHKYSNYTILQCNLDQCIVIKTNAL